ncbi:MAG: hypothetical protein ABEJ65_04105 [bacterium]
MKKRYLCHNCDQEFTRPAEEEPTCPSCFEQNVTFEELIEPGYLYVLWQKISPVFNYFFLPWRFYRERTLERSGFYFLVFVQTLVLMGIVYSRTGVVPLERGLSSLSIQFFPGTIFVFRNFLPFLEPLYRPEANVSFHVISLVWLLFYFWEITWFTMLYVSFIPLGCIQEWDRLTACVAGTVWLPNLFFAFVQWLLLRFQIISLIPGVTEVEYGMAEFQTGVWILLSWCTLVFVLSLLSLKGIKVWNLPFVLGIALFLQFFSGGAFVYVVGWIYSWLGISPVVPGDGHWLKLVAFLVAWPWSALIIG